MLEFQVSADELECLIQAVLRDEALTALLMAYDGSRAPKTTIRLSRREAERLRECLTTELAMVGFDEDYRPNERGKLLENLINRFYVG